MVGLSLGEEGRQCGEMPGGVVVEGAMEFCSKARKDRHWFLTGQQGLSFMRCEQWCGGNGSVIGLLLARD